MDPADFDEARQRMVSEQLTGFGRHITNPRVITAISNVPRHEFVPRHLWASAYEDGPLPIGHGQTISQPYVVAFMSQSLRPEPTDRILEVGTGLGYQAAVLAQLAAEVFTVEIVHELAEAAQANFRRLSLFNITLREGDGYEGWPEASPFSGIILTCAPEQVPQPLVDQLAEGGRMILPLGPPGTQDLLLLEKRDGKLWEQKVLQVRFVPMTGKIMDLPGRY